MKIALVILILWCLLLVIYSIGCTIGLGEEIERKDKQLRRLEKELEDAGKRNRDLSRIVYDPNCRIVGECEACHYYRSDYGECMRTMTFQKEHDYCSDWQPLEKEL